MRSLAAFADAGLVSAEAAEALAPVAARYAVAITPAMAALGCEPGIARQFVPTLAEFDSAPAERADPIDDDAHSPVEGVVHRYPDRALLKLTHTCPVYCRFCFRRESVGPQGPATLSGDRLAAALGYIAATPAIWEVILTGGDPFMVSARRAGEVTRALAAMEHVKVVRWHTRVPTVDPDRVTPAFVKALRAPGIATWVAVHANHPAELTDAAVAAIGRLVDAGIPVVSQTVLLKGVNDDVDTLEALMRGFVAARVRPYYLHHADLAPGTGHFRMTIEEGRALVEALHARASGLAQPTYVLDVPGGAVKATLREPGARDGAARTRDGVWVAYPPEG
jgi:lysine 2,3-aminomutase